ncbi:fad linked oxidase, c-terminal:fad linked oxidase, n-terminal, putative [Heliomicrobium modesticaldum Ice1]|uniref:Fad linked oxidase, c-terminal:fad linked oxidase, n-terminal, putative n=1 Tax=Heliobacterium modesticaldum (strain ATCC 51547 / Ice1) TaxID=498761 RepID=B0TDV6_HELMI|nr:fad linked oxidase, c-terminal:fad linked oxidase, n-terminal, putative [Heliomicrobium modesticaldum Ice1]
MIVTYHAPADDELRAMEQFKAICECCINFGGSDWMEKGISLFLSNRSNSRQSQLHKVYR